MCAPWARPTARRCCLRRQRSPRASRGSEQGPWQGRLQSAHDPAQMPPPALRFCITSLLRQSSTLATGWDALPEVVLRPEQPTRSSGRMTCNHVHGSAVHASAKDCAILCLRRDTETTPPHTHTKKRKPELYHRTLH